MNYQMKHLEKNSFFDEDNNEIEDFEFNQDFEIEDQTRSPWMDKISKKN